MILFSENRVHVVRIESSHARLRLDLPDSLHNNNSLRVLVDLIFKTFTSDSDSLTIENIEAGQTIHIWDSGQKNRLTAPLNALWQIQVSPVSPVYPAIQTPEEISKSIMAENTFIHAEYNFEGKDVSLTPAFFVSLIQSNILNQIKKDISSKIAFLSNYTPGKCLFSPSSKGVVSDLVHLSSSGEAIMASKQTLTPDLVLGEGPKVFKESMLMDSLIDEVNTPNYFTDIRFIGATNIIQREFAGLAFLISSSHVRHWNPLGESIEETTIPFLVRVNGIESNTKFSSLNYGVGISDTKGFLGGIMATKTLEVQEKEITILPTLDPSYISIRIPLRGLKEEVRLKMPWAWDMAVSPTKNRRGYEFRCIILSAGDSEERFTLNKHTNRQVMGEFIHTTFQIESVGRNVNVDFMMSPIDASFGITAQVGSDEITETVEIPWFKFKIDNDPQEYLQIIGGPKHPKLNNTFRITYTEIWIKNIADAQITQTYSVVPLKDITAFCFISSAPYPLDQEFTLYLHRPFEGRAYANLKTLPIRRDLVSIQHTGKILFQGTGESLNSIQVISPQMFLPPIVSARLITAPNKKLEITTKERLEALTVVTKENIESVRHFQPEELFYQPRQNANFTYSLDITSLNIPSSAEKIIYYLASTVKE